MLTQLVLPQLATHQRGILVILLVIVVAGTATWDSVVSAGSGDLVQLDYRWYENIDAIQPTTALAAENTSITGGVSGTAYHLRMNVENTSAPALAIGAVFELQYGSGGSCPSSCTWTDVGGLASGSIWRGHDNATPTDGVELTAILLASSVSNDRNTYEEANTATTLTSFGNGKESEFGWVIEDNGATAGTAYYFRMVISNDTALSSYTNYPTLTPGTPAVTVTETSASTDITEGSTTDTYDLVLDAKPSANVTITISPDADANVTTTPLTFTTANWDTPQTVTVSAINDAIVEGSHSSTITHSASGGGYTGVSISNVVANVTDNDSPTVTITESGGSTDVTEGGATDTYDVVLDLEPSASVTVTATPDVEVNATTTPLTFTTGNWNVAQTITVSAVNDGDIEGGHTGTITHSASGGDYDSASIASVVANVTDDDAPGVTITESGGSTDVTEAGPTDTYDVVLDALPSASVTITITVAGADATTDLSMLTFTTGNYGTPQTVTVTAFNDAIVEGSHSDTISHSASGGGYDSVVIDDVVPNITDNDSPTVTITESSGSTDVTEGGATDTYDVVLDLEPSASVTITLTPDADVSVSPNPLTFTTGNWNSAQTVTVTAVNDAIVEGSHTGTITHSASGGSYDSASISNVVANVTDNDTASVTVTESSGSTDVTEGGATDTYTVVLDLEPSASVTITITNADGQATPSPTPLTFTTGNWNSAQTVTVTAVDDGDFEGTHTGTITHSASGGSYDGVSITNVVANVTDNDPAVTITQNDYRWYENTDAVQPTTAIAGENTEITDIPQTDVIRLRINLLAGGSNIPASSSFKVQFSVTTTGGWIDVGGIGSGAKWQGANNATPADGAAITAGLLTSSDSPETQTYEEENNATTGSIWNKNKAAEWDWVIENNDADGSTQYYFRIVKGGGTVLDGYTNYPSATTRADPSVTVTETGSTDVTEGGATDTYDVVLDVEPVSTVTITLTPDADVSVSPNPLTFTTGNYNVAQTVTVTAFNDAIVEGSHTGTTTHSASGGGYDGVSIASVVANVTDNETPTVTVTESGGSTDISEAGATDTYTVVLDLEPSGTVTITMDTSTDSEISTDPTTLTFTTGNWNSAQTVTVSAIDDLVDEGSHTGTITHTASGGSYDSASISNVVANITDNDSIGVTITESGGSTDITEGGATDTYDVVLNTLPSASVTITMSTSTDSEISTDPVTLTFTTGNFSTPQTVTVTAVNDVVVEGSHTGTITHSASGGGYDAVVIDDVVSNITDNDSPTVTITESSASTDVTEGGATDTYDVVLDLEPSASVTVTLTPDADVSVSPSPLTFTTGNWNSAQTVTVTAVNDVIVESSHTGTITHSASGGDYDSASISNVVANITDNDTGSVTITESSGSTDITEGGATDTYDVVLDLEPSASVTITITNADGQSTPSPTPLTFTTGNWNSAQTVTVTAVDDGDFEGSHTGTITHSASGGSYDGVSITNVVANITDNDPVVTITQSDYRWYQNTDAVQPTTALAGENTLTSDVTDTTILRLRLNLLAGATNVPSASSFKLQFSVTTTGGWTDVGGISSGAIWRGANNASPADGAAITTQLLGSSDSSEKQTYEEENNATTGATWAKNKTAEWDWVVQSNAPLGETNYYFRVVKGGGTVLDGYTNYPTLDTDNVIPDDPTFLGAAAYVDNGAGWSTDNTPILTFTLIDHDTQQDVKYQIQLATDTGFTALVVDYTSDLASQGVTNFTVGQSGGSYSTGSPGMTLADEGTGYYWRVRTIDEVGGTSGYEEAGVDATEPVAGTVLDGVAADIDLTSGSLTEMSANWSSFTDATSGVASYEYSVGTTVGGTDIKSYTSVGASTSVTDSSLVMHTGQTYFFNVRATDAAGNVMSTPASSDGQAVGPTLSVTISATTINLGDFKPSNSYTATNTITVTVSTNAYNGFQIKMFATDFLRSLSNPAVVIGDFSGGTYIAPAVWGGGDTGFGYNTDDCDVNGSLFWTGASCTGSMKFAPLSQTCPGDLVADHTALVTGATGAINSEDYDIFLRGTTTGTQDASDYLTNVVFVVIPIY